MPVCHRNILITRLPHHYVVERLVSITALLLAFSDVSSFFAIPSVSDAGGFTRAWTYATEAARVLSLSIAIMLVLVFALLLRRIVRDWRVAALGTFALAFFWWP